MGRGTVMNEMRYYEKFRAVPKDAQKPFNNGRFKGTDINPMWRIKMLTEAFGPAGIGWYTELTDKWLDNVEDETVCSVAINLHVKVDGEWSKPIYGIGGSKILAQEKKGPYADDEAYKKAYTDAISVACKALGMGADIYWGNDRTKYSAPNAESETNSRQAKKTNGDHLIEEKKALDARCSKLGQSPTKVLEMAGWKPGQPFDADVVAKCNVVLDEIEEAQNEARQ